MAMTFAPRAASSASIEQENSVAQARNRPARHFSLSIITTRTSDAD